MSDYAVSILIVGGVLNLGLSYLLGWILSALRMRGPIEPHRWLLTAHTVSLQQALLLIAFAVCMPWVALSEQLQVLAAWLLIAASFFQDFSGVLNWFRKVDDQFAARSLGWVFGTFNALLNTAGLLLVLYGVYLRFMG
ncbi:MAG TPA: hypothetical protein VI299_08085 [Polyangiales bacterium]